VGLPVVGGAVIATVGETEGDDDTEETVGDTDMPTVGDADIEETVGDTDMPTVGDADIKTVGSVVGASVGLAVEAVGLGVAGPEAGHQAPLQARQFALL